MATVIGTVYLTGCNYQLQYDVLSQSVTNNSSTVRLYGVLNVTNNNISWSRGSASVHTESGSIGTYYSKGSYVVIQRDFTWGHDSNGDLTIGIGASLSTSYVSGSTSGNITLPHINRISAINGFSGSDLEGNFSATYTSYVSTYEQRLRISIPNVKALQTTSSYVSGANVTLTSDSLTYIETYMNTNKTPKINLGGVIETYSGSTKIGESNEIVLECSFSNANPTVGTPTVVETNTKVSAIYGTTAATLVQNKSQPKFTITPTANKGATIASVSMTHNGQTQTLNASPYEFTWTATTNTFEITVVDSRGLSNTSGGTITKTLVEYEPVKITSLTAKRTSATGSDIKVTLEATYWQQTFNGTQNSPTITYALDSGTATSLSGAETDKTNHKVTLTTTISNLISYKKTGTINIVVKDLLSESPDSRTISKGIPVFDIGEDDIQINGKLYIADTGGDNSISFSSGAEDAYMYCVSDSNTGTLSSGAITWTNCVVKKSKNITLTNTTGGTYKNSYFTFAKSGLYAVTIRHQWYGASTSSRQFADLTVENNVWGRSVYRTTDTQNSASTSGTDPCYVNTFIIPIKAGTNIMFYLYSTCSCVLYQGSGFEIYKIRDFNF